MVFFIVVMSNMTRINNCVIHWRGKTHILFNVNKNENVLALLMEMQNSVQKFYVGDC